MNQERIGKFIAECRKDKKLTQEDLANKLGVSINAVSKWERGICLMDMALLKPICEILDINVNELLSGEKIKNKDYSKNAEENFFNIFGLFKKYETKQKILSIIIIIIGISIILTLLFLGGYYYGKNIKLYNDKVHFNTKITPNCTGKITKYYTSKDKTIYYYCLDDLSINDNINLKNYIKKSGKNIDDGLDKIISKMNNVNKYVLWDGGTTEYRNNEITIIKCHTLDDNNDIYIGPNDMATSKSYNNGVCGNISNKKSFTKTYMVEDLMQGEEENIYYVTLSLYQTDKKTVMIKTPEKLLLNHLYEFTFQNSLYNIDEDSIASIFEKSELINIKETNKLENNQIQDPVV